MKYGLLYYKDTDNIGDDIQSYAQSRFLPRIDYMIDRESLNEFVPKEKEYVKTIMNAWYQHDKFNFGISPYIYPLMISMFFKKYPYEAGITVGIDYLNEDVQEKFKKFGPVGCRDLHTKKIMDKLNIKNYFSGCMTLTLERFPDIEKGDYIVLVGLKDDEIEYVKSKTDRKVIVFKQDVKKGKFSNETWEQRKERVEKTLKLYQGAHMVVTNKLHCSLPCLSLQTPVLLLYDTSFPENKDRIGTYTEYLNYIKREDLKNTNIDFDNPKPNPTKYLELRKNLIKKCNNFINDDINITEELPDIKIFKKYSYKNKIEKDVILKHLYKLQKTYEKECEKSSYMYDEIQRLKILEKELSMAKKSRCWRFIEKVRRLK